MESKYKAQHSANFFLAKAAQEGMTLDQLKLIKLVYIAYGWVIAVLDYKLFSEEIEAWRYGPVIPSLYHEFKKFGRDPIKGKSVRTEMGEDFFVRVVAPEIPMSDTRTRNVMEMVWDSYKQYSGVALVRKTHQEDSPWTQVYVAHERDIPIPDKLIKPHFEGKIGQYLDAAARVG